MQPSRMLLAYAAAWCLLGGAGCLSAPAIAADAPATAPASGIEAPAAMPAGLSAALDSVHGEDLMADIRQLSSDDFEGRSVGTHGEDLSVAYIEQRFRALGLAPGNPDGSYVQAVPLTGHRARASAVVHVAGRTLPWQSPADLVVWSYERKEALHLHDVPLVFVGYGVKAPEYDWDDFKDADVRGKMLVVLVNDPQVTDPADPGRLDDRVFKGKAMTYYGRWTYKFEAAAARGAAGALIVHDTALAGYPWAVVVNSNSNENFDIRRAGGNPDFPPVPGWLHADRAHQLFQAAGLDLDQLRQAALRRDFRPVALPATLDLDLAKTMREVDSRNVLARLEGSDPVLRDETVVYTAHWDHFGWNPELPGGKHDQVFHGALDNASGVAALLALAKAYRALPQPPRRSILFIATTAEERGLLGAQYYATHPLYPLRKTLADINIDGINPWGRTHDITVIGLGNSDLDDRMAQAARSQGRVVSPDRESEKGYFYRADHLEFARQGVPALYTSAGQDFLDRSASFGHQQVEEFTAHRYHKPTDVVDASWDLSGAVEDVRLLFEVGLDVAQGSQYPQWRPGTEFRARREAMMVAP